MVTRIITAVVGIIVGLGIIYLGGAIFFLLILLLALLGLNELSQLLRSMQTYVNKPMAVFATVLLLLAYYYQAWLIIIILFALALFFLAINMMRDFINANFPDFAGTFLAVVYITLMFGFPLALRTVDNGFFIIIYLLAIIWGTDAGAYFIGTSIGKNKLAPNISPKKSYQGSIGGLLIATLIALLLSPIAEITLLWALLLGIVVSVSAQLGDLFESMLKRKAGIKDSGNIFPGHGGILDRFDGFLFAAPFYYGILELINII